MSLNLAWMRFSLLLLVWGVSPGLQGAIAGTTEEVAPTTVLMQAELGDRSAPVRMPTASPVDELLKQGKLQYRRAEFKQAIATYQQVLAQPGVSTSAKIEALSQLGDMDFWIEQIPEAEAKFQQALKLARESGDRQAEGRVLALVAAVQRSRQEYAKALDTLKTALEINQWANDRKGEARSRFFMGTVLHLQKQYPRALETFQQALKIDQSIGNQDEMCHIYDWIAITYRELKDLKQAEALSQQQQSFSQSIGYRLAEYDGLATIVGLRQQQKQPEQVLQAYQKQLLIAQAADNAWFQKATLVNLGFVYVNQNQLPKGLEFYQKALVVARTIDDNSVGWVRNRIGLAYDKAEQYPQALEAYQQAIGLYQKTGNRTELAQAWLNVGETYYAQKQYPQAREAFQQTFALYQQLNNLPGQAKTFWSIGHAYLSESKFDLALETVRKAENLEGLTDKDRRTILSLKSSVYSSLVIAYDNPRQHAKQLEILQKGIELAKQLKEPKSELQYLALTGQIYRFWGRYAEALDMYQQALSRAREVKDNGFEILILGHIGLIYSAQANYPEALKLYEQALQLSRASNQDDSRSLGSLNNMANVYSVQGQYAQALSTHQQVLAAHQRFYKFFFKGVTPDTIRSVCADHENFSDIASLKEICDKPTQIPTGRNLDFFRKMIHISEELEHSGIATSYLNVAKLYSDQGDYPKALEFQQKAIEIFREQKDENREATALNNMGTVYADQGNYARALELVQQALNVAIVQNDPASEIIYQLNLGVIYSNWGKYPEALAAYQRSQTLATQLGQASSKAFTLLRTATVYSNQGQFAQALTNLQSARDIWQKVGEPANESRAISAIAAVYEQLGQYPQAIAAYQQALAITQKTNARPLEVKVLWGLATTYQKQGQTEQALKTFQQALNLAREMGDRDYESLSLAGMSKIYLKQSQPQQALEALQLALTIQQYIGTRPNAADTLSSIGQAQLQLRNFSEAQSSLQQAIALAHDTGDTPVEAQALNNLGQLFAQQNQLELAIVFYKQSVSVFETIRQGIRKLDRNQQESYTQTIADTYRALADLLLKQNRILEAQQILDLLKVQELNDYLTNVRGGDKALTVLPPETEILRKYGELQKGAIELGKEFNQLEDLDRAGTLASAQRDRKNQLLKLQQELNQQFNQFTQRSDVVALTNQLTPNAIKQGVNLEQLDGLRDELRRLNAVMIYPLILDDRLELIITTPDSPPLRRTTPIKREELNRTIAEFRQVLQDPTQDAKPLAQKLYTWMIQPLEADLKQANAKTIIYAPDAQLRYIPLAALHDGQQWLVQRFRINNITAQSLTKFTHVPSSGLRVLAGASAVAHEVIIGNKRQTFKALPFAAQEVNNVATLLPNTTKLIDQDFSLDGFTSRMNAFAIVHLATHASFVPEDPTQSFILFGDGKTANLQQIGNWTLKDVDLVVLSACETAVGIQALGSKALGRGEEILGLGYQFQSRGAKATIASLWSVDDGGTQALISAFYQQLQSGKLTKVEALQQAQIVLLNTKTKAVLLPSDRTVVRPATPNQPARSGQLSPGYSHPYYWAPFILIGNGL